MGADKARWLNTLTKVNNILNKSNGDIVALLEPSSEMLANLQQEFHTMFEKRREKEGKRVKLYCFYEELPVRGIGKPQVLRAESQSKDDHVQWYDQCWWWSCDTNARDEIGPEYQYLG
ncbi:unnamed protein product [Alternaria alternata]